MPPEQTCWNQQQVPTQSTILGATGIVGSFIRQKLVELGERPYALSRNVQRDIDNVVWLQGDLAFPAQLKIPYSNILYSTVHPLLVASALERIAPPNLRKLVFFTSTSIVTKIDSVVPSERDGIRQLADGEEKLRRVCEKLGLDWVVLRPTIVYAEGQDANVTRLSRFIERFGFFPLAGLGGGLRQPVHAEDLATAAISAALSPLTCNKVYALPGKDIITYREMVGRIFDGLGKPRKIVQIPPSIWKMAFKTFSPFFPNANYAMGMRMSQDMVFDGSPAFVDFGWDPRPFRPSFRR